MTSSFQRQSQIRKVTYGVLILVLFTVSLFWRQFLEAQADRLAVREQSLGDVELSGSALRLMLIGSRGATLCGLWVMAIEMQKKHEWNKLEMLVASITKLQPHYKTPWMFQSWNLAYNVPAECDRVKDKYYFISRGIELLAEGERQNRNNPDMRFELGFYLHNKIGLADEQNTLRSLFQLSCIDPVERDPARLRRPDGSVDLDKFEAFCKKYAHLVRRLHDSLACNTPDDVLDFLTENYELPCRYEYPTVGGGPSVPGRLRPPEKQFPVLPRRGELGESDLPYAAEVQQLPEEFDNFAAGGLWFAYAQLPLPPANPASGSSGDDYDRTKYRMPRRMATILFRQYPALSATFVAQRQQKEGWFDRGWEVDEGRQGINRWFPDRKVVLGDRNWSGQTWDRARILWEDHGTRTGLYLDPRERDRKKELAQKYRTAYGVAETEIGPPLRSEHDVDADMVASFQAHRQLYWYESNRRLSNFPHFFAQARTEVQPNAIAAHRLFFKAEQMRHAYKLPADIIAVYEEGLPLWKRVLEENDDFRHDKDVQEETYKLQYEYLKLLREEERGRLAHLKPLLVLGDYLTQVSRAPGATLWLPTVDMLGSGIVGPFDGNAADGQPFLSPEAVRLARSRLGFVEPPPQQPQTMDAPKRR
jgi:hypothetical protein